MRREVVLAAALVVAGSGFTAGTAAAEPARGLEWGPCKGHEENTAVECASMTVPIDWTRPAKGTIDVAVARTKATDPAARIGTLVYMPGGPGDSGVNRLLGGGVVPAEVAARFDVVSYDPRGTNRSHPVVCDAELATTLPNGVLDAGARLSDVKAHAKALGDSCREHTGPLIDHVDNVSVAHDIDALRAALGERRVTLYGRSYGTLAGQMYAENFPHRVRGLVLDSVFNHGLPTEQFLVTQAAAGEDAFAAFTRWCAADTTCALHGRDISALYGDLYERSVRGELTEPGDPARRITPMDLTMDVLNRLYAPAWTSTANRLAALAGQPSTGTAQAEETVPFPVAAACADHRVRISSQRQWNDMWHAQKAAAPVLRTHFAWLAMSLCSGWPAAVPNPQHPTEIDRRVPTVLLMNSLHDPATSHAWARSVARQIGDSVLLTYDGSGHGVMNRTDCTRAVFTAYVLDGTTPRPGAHCAAATEGTE